MLSYLEQIERQRLEKTKELMLRYADITMSEVVQHLNTQHGELLPQVEAIEAHENLDAFITKSLKKRPGREAGMHKQQPYDKFVDCAMRERCSTHMAECGGPIKSGWLECQGDGVFNKKFERRYATLWPRNFNRLSMPSPQLYLWESDRLGNLSDGTEQTKPARVMLLKGNEISIPDKPSAKYPHAFRFGTPRGEGGGHGRGEGGAKGEHAVLAFADGAIMAEWMRSLSEFGQSTVRLDFFGTSCESLAEMMAQQKETLEDTTAVSGQESQDAACRVPVVLIDAMLSLDRLGARKEEGIFRVPGDTAETAALRKRYEEGELCVEDESESSRYCWHLGLHSSKSASNIVLRTGILAPARHRGCVRRWLAGASRAS